MLHPEPSLPLIPKLGKWLQHHLRHHRRRNQKLSAQGGDGHNNRPRMRTRTRVPQRRNPAIQKKSLKRTVRMSYQHGAANPTTILKTETKTSKGHRPGP